MKYIKNILNKLHLFSVITHFKKTFRFFDKHLKKRFMTWWKKTKHNLYQLLNIIPALTDWRCLIALIVGITFSILTYHETDDNFKIVWTVFAGLGNGVFMTFVLSYFGEYPLKQRLIETIKSLYSLNDFLINLKNDHRLDNELKGGVEININNVNLSIQRWGDKVDYADIEKWKNEIKKIEKYYDGNRKKYEIDITELEEFGISNNVISELTGSTETRITEIKEQQSKRNKK